MNLPKGQSARDAGTRSRESRSRVDGQVSTEATDGRHRPICCLDSRSDSHLALGSEGCILYSESIKVASARPSFCYNYGKLETALRPESCCEAMASMVKR